MGGIEGMEIVEQGKILLWTNRTMILIKILSALGEENG
jgi:hypothetical protein